MVLDFGHAEPHPTAPEIPKRYRLTLHGALMAANILNNPRAVAMSVYVIRAFVKMRLAFGANGVLCILHSALFILLDPRRNRPNRKLASI